MSNLIMLVGNIGSGKSTLVKEIVKQGYIVVSLDAIRYMVGGGAYTWDVDMEPEVFKIGKYALKLLSDVGYDIGIDETNMSRYVRNWHFSVTKNKAYTYTAIVMPELSKVESVKRRMRDNHGYNDCLVWGDVWERFNKGYVEPSKDEGFSKIIHLKEGFTWDTIAKDL